MAKFELDLEIPERVEDEEDATDRQKQFIRALMRETRSSGFPEDVLQELGKWQASSMIEQLQNFKKQLRSEMPSDSSKITGPKDQSVWTANIGTPLLICLCILLVLWLFFSV